MDKDLDQAILVTGASGGVGSIGLQILSKSAIKISPPWLEKKTKLKL